MFLPLVLNMNLFTTFYISMTALTNYNCLSTFYHRLFAFFSHLLNLTSRVSPKNPYVPGRFVQQMAKKKNGEKKKERVKSRVASGTFSRSKCEPKSAPFSPQFICHCTDRLCFATRWSDRHPWTPHYYYWAKLLKNYWKRWKLYMDKKSIWNHSIMSLRLKYATAV